MLKSIKNLHIRPLKFPTFFDRVILRGYILDLFYEGGVAFFLKSMGFVKRSNGVMHIFIDPPANRLDILSFKGLIDIALLNLVKYLIILVRHWRAGQLNSHISKQAKKCDIPILWWTSVLGGKNGAKLEYV